MNDAAPLVYLDLELSGLREALALPEGQCITAADRPTPEQRGQVRVLVTGGPTHLPVERVDSFPNLSLIVSVAAGHDGIDLGHARSRGIAVASSIGVNAADVADLAAGSLIALVREIVAGDRLVREGGWFPRRAVPTRSVGGLRVGIAGFGAIGQEIARRMAAFGCRVEWYGPRPKETPFPRVATLRELAERSDALFVAAHLSPETEGMIDADIIGALGADGYLVNVGRGPLIDEDALIAALREGRLGGAALDVFVEEPTSPERWRGVPNTVLTPHLGGVTHEALRGVFTRTAENVRRGLAGEAVEGRVA